ncbi:MAG TPA: lamin tail domain-containing protein, partial [Bacillota bacterium]|nr:lamin tail domain-containing protein [Bacillota bacterium]
MNQTFRRSFGGLTAVFALAFAGASVYGQLLINEIMYHPPPAIPEAPSKEWIELYNSGTNAVDLSGWRFTKGLSFTFTNVTLPAGGYLVVAANRAVFQTNYPTVTNVVGDWTGKLRNSGETLELSDALGQKVDTVSYATEGDWALRRPGEPYPGKPTWWVGWQWTTPADGLGKSLELINANLPNHYGQNWSASAPDGGTPG